MAQKRFGVGLMAAILKFKMAADRGSFLSGTRPEIQKSTSVPNLVLLYRFARFFPYRLDYYNG
jgi:hypothetical protein